MRCKLIGTCLVLIVSMVAFGQHPQVAERCNCEVLLGPCEATAHLDAHWISIVSSSQRCSMVELNIADGMNSTLRVIDGYSRHPWTSISDAEVEVARCLICADSDFGGKVSALGVVSDNPVAEKLPDDLSWLEGAWCWDWYGKPGKNTYRQVKGDVFEWGVDMKHTISLENGFMKITDSMGATYERQVIDSENMIWTKRAYGRHSAEENVRMWRCD